MIERVYKYTPSAQPITQPSTSYGWTPNASPIDPHDEPYEAGYGAPSTGPTPTNIAGGGDFDPPDSADDPHDAATVDTSDGDDDCADCGPVASNIHLD